MKKSDGIVDVVMNKFNVGDMDFVFVDWRIQFWFFYFIVFFYWSKIIIQ